MTSHMSRKGPENDYKWSNKSTKCHPKGGFGTKKSAKMLPRGALGRHGGAKAPKLLKRMKLRDSILEHLSIKMAPKCIKKTCFKKMKILSRFSHVFGLF